MSKSIEKRDPKGQRALRILMALLLALSSILAATQGLMASSAYAAETASLSIRGKIPYAGYTTTWMYADGEMA